MEVNFDEGIHDYNITNQVREQLRKRILASKFRVGEKINIDRLSSEWNVSKTPIRESLRSLEEERLVKYIPRKGYFIMSLENEEIKDLLELRMIFENYALRKGFNNIDKKKMTKLLAECEHEYEAFKKNKPNYYSQADYQFHLEIVQAAGNKRMIKIYESLRNSIDLVWLAQGKDVGASMPEHRQLKDAIQKGDLEDAKMQLRMLFTKVEELLMPNHFGKESH